MITRRELLSTSLVVAILPRVGFARADDAFRLRAEIVEFDVLGDGDNVESLGFNGSTPGPVLRMKAGEPFAIDLENGLDQPTAVHWHGLRIENAMDGASGLTQAPIEAGDRFEYRFTPPDAGTFWYHSHERSFEQVARGLFGAIVVEEKEPPLVDHDVVLYLDDWRLAQNGSLDQNFENGMDISHNGRLGNFARVLFSEVLTPKKGARLRLRLLNAATDRIFTLRVDGVEGKTVAMDGMPLFTPLNVESFELAPGQRVDLIVDVVADQVDFVFVGAQGDYPMGHILTEGEQVRSTQAIEALKPNEVAEPNFDQVKELELTLQGGMMAPAAPSGEIWAISGSSSMSGPPLGSFSAGDTVRFNIQNQTSFAHIIHWHGHHMQVEERLGLGSLRDGVVVEPQESIAVVGVLDNPGKWMLHCHMLAHQHGGMLSWYEVG